MPPILDSEEWRAVRQVVLRFHESGDFRALRDNLRGRLGALLQGGGRVVFWREPSSSLFIDPHGRGISEAANDGLAEQFIYCPASQLKDLQSCVFREVELPEGEKSVSKDPASLLRDKLRDLPNHHACWNCLQGALRELIRPRANVGLGFIRFLPRGQWSVRDREILRHIWPHFLQGLRIVIQKQIERDFEKASDILERNTAPMAFLGEDLTVVLSNSPFTDLLPVDSGNNLPPALRQMIQSQPRSPSDIGRSVGAKLKIPLFIFNKGAYMLRLARVTMKGKNIRWMVRIDPLGKAPIEPPR